jgi:RND family efflux transporter MFP subunit
MRGVPTPLALALACALAAGCAARKPPAPPPPKVTVATPLAMDVVDWDDFVGQFVAVDSVDVRPRVSGYLQSVGFTDGDFVKKGQVLFVIDPRPYQAAFDQAKGGLAHARAALVNAHAQAARGATLLAAKAISQQAYEVLVATERQAAADVVSAQAAVNTAALNLAFTRVTAPLPGRISDRRIAPGNLVTADTTVLTNIVNLDPIRFAFTGSEALYLKYERENAAGTRASSRRAANPVEIRLQDEATYRWKGRMDFVDNALDTGSGTIRGRAVIANPDHFLTPGMFGHLRLLGSGSYPALLIPDQAVVTDQERQVVYVVGPDAIARMRPVELGPIARGLRVVRAGLAAGDEVVIDGLQRAQSGVKVFARQGRIALAAPTAQPPPPAAPPSSSAEPVGVAR